ncbi:MAG TPA: NUDIX domain-containing protein [Accumulibacter sp.]|nr:NUDIX domain-containing protein [Accumulibacter sp.]HMW17024.1 NUDIX domain-containing protein [Accumulibacter sp.]HNC17276.1 NUDIX domain-containing protein [Accumulibacter sp.]HND79830.1 NUDIX domain-containing protein [Accumulibacter sp.]HNE13985.1 NUDIX domain-containing protein [Accumulibacter sp.]
MKRQRATVIVEIDRRLLLVENRGGLLLLPGGGIQPGETRLRAAERELLEETGLTADSLLFLFQYHSATNCHHVFWAAVAGTPRADDDAIALHWLADDDSEPLEKMSLASRQIVERFRALRHAQPMLASAIPAGDAE